MTRNWQHLGALAAVVACAGMSSQVALAQADEDVIEEIVTVGTRSAKPRSAADSTVPIDVISDDELDTLGNTADLTDNIRALVPSYTATPATGDGTAFVRPTSLRGTSSDQTLVLINGKRRHRSALVQFLAPAAGNGAHSVDIGMIPTIALKSVEVLRDGAASQYGSDAIAGVINFIMKDASEGGEVQVQYGQYYEGEESIKFAANAGVGVGDNGFVNASIEWIDNEALSRGVQRPDAQALIDSGVTEVGQDAPFGDAPLAQSWGRPETSGIRFFVNSGFDISASSQLYARFGFADTEGRYRFFFRNPNTHSTMISLRNQGFTGLPGGYTPFLDGDQKDGSLVVGVDGEYASGMLYDFSFGFGKNELDYFLNNTTNHSLGPGDGTTLPQMDFDVGGYEQKELNVNADFSLPISDRLNLAFGAEWREETYGAVAGEPSSFFEAGASGLKGVTSDDAVDNARDNIAVYADLEHDLSDALLLQYALRYENFSDFGDTINWKVAGRYRVSDALAIRGAVSTGFHAPTPGQANVRTTITTADSISGLLVEEGLFPPTDPNAVAVGGTALREEESLNISLGFTADIGDNTTLTIDLYQIEVDGRIFKTGNIPVPPPATTGSIAFYTNALDVEHSGLDLVLTSGWEWSANASTDVTLAASYNEVDVTGQTPVLRPILVENPVGSGNIDLVGFDPILPVSPANIEDIENNFPNERFVLTANTNFGEQFNLMFRANYYGKHFDERGTIGDPVSPSAEIGATVYFDVDLGFQLNDNWRINLGAINIGDEFVDEVGPPNANRLSVGLQYPRRSAANYEGGSWYLRGTYLFE
ncbi:MAG: TonB-dependent receptor plug domain-containing protein [Woeseia sp.]